MNSKRWLLAPVLSLVACSGGPSSSSSSSGEATQVVFHTQTAIVTAALRSSDSDGGSSGGVSKDRIRERVERLYPAACLDEDRDRDGVPDSVDHSFDDSSSGGNSSDDAAEGGHRSGDDDLDGGHRSGDDDLDGGHRSGDDDLDGGHRSGDDDLDGGRSGDDRLRCRRCNRGPGNAGDFRYEERGGEAKLDRGRVVSRSDSTVVVAGPNGPITIEVGSGTRVDTDHGALTPGAEIRAEGLLRANATRTIQAERLEVLCPGPGVVPDAELPKDVPLTPVSGTDIN